MDKVFRVYGPGSNSVEPRFHQSTHKQNEQCQTSELRERAKVRAQIRRTVFRTPFELETVEFMDSKPAVLRGWYRGVVDVEVVASFGWASPGNSTYCSIQLVLVGDRVIVEPRSGDLYRKVLQDVICALESPSGRLWRLKSGSEMFWSKTLEAMREIAEVGGKGRL